MIENPIQTTRALLTWQLPLEAGEPRDRHVVGELRDSSDGIQFRYLSDERLAPAFDLGFEGYPGLPISTYQSEPRPDNVEAILMRRLPPIGRADFDRFKATFGLSADAEFTPLSLLAYTGARLTSDSFGVAETFDGFDGQFDYIFDVAGYRRYEQNAVGMVAGDTVQLVHERDNQHDQNAVQVLNGDGDCLGYINRAQSAFIADRLISCTVNAQVFRFNGRLDYPKLFVHSRVQPQGQQVAA
ncbi:HIRAN domain-containing protein [Sulfitobacter brevis]|uniref:HIRAN domain-containing protein n=1 Tax=Sulfitobacter brevis TaxID=74348 RepID=A0A1I1YQF0_9RHOB|nr:HIRAN domain-containing protein [Sulfitobacter brevis]SFE20393.1 HIRAN domain-containing protein [Sulfitobacter brevis]